MTSECLLRGYALSLLSWVASLISGWIYQASRNIRGRLLRALKKLKFWPMAIKLFTSTLGKPETAELQESWTKKRAVMECQCIVVYQNIGTTSNLGEFMYCSNKEDAETREHQTQSLQQLQSSYHCSMRISISCSIKEARAISGCFGERQSWHDWRGH